MMRADSGGASGVDQATDTLLTDLPHAAISVILAALDLNSLCALSRTCSLLHGLASQPALWPHYKPEGCCLVAARLAMAGVLRLPPQVFAAQLDLRRSRRFPITINLLNLRPVLCVTDTDALAAQVASALQERVARTAKCLWRYDSARDWPPLAAINVVRADRSCVRMTVRPAAIVPRMVSQLQALGWPPLPTQPAAAPAAAAPAVQEQERQLQAAAHQLTDGESFSARVQQVAWLRDACPASPQKQRSQPAALEAAAGAADASTSTADGGSGGCTAEGGVTSPREPRERLAQLRPLGEGSPGGSPVRGNARQLPDYSGLRDAALRQLAGELPDWPSESFSRLAEASLQLLAVSGVPEPCACIRIGSRGRWALFVQQPCALMARVAQQWQLCWAVADAFSAASQQHNQQGAGPHAQPSCPPAERCFDLPALLAALPALPAQAQQGCWQAASSEDAGFCLAGLHQLVPVAKEAAAKGRPALLSTVAGELKAALAEWQHECMGAGSRSSLAELLLVPAGGSCSREAAAVAAALVQAGCTLPRYALAGEGTAEAGQGAHAGEHCAMPAECTEVGQSQHAQVQATSWQTLPPSAQQALVRYQLHLEALRAWAWCAWLLGVAL